MDKPYICKKLYQNLELSRNSSNAKALAVCKIFIPDYLPEFKTSKNNDAGEKGKNDKNCEYDEAFRCCRIFMFFIIYRFLKSFPNLSFI